MRDGESQWILPASGASLDAGPVYPHRDLHNRCHRLGAAGDLQPGERQVHFHEESTTARKHNPEQVSGRVGASAMQTIACLLQEPGDANANLRP